MTPLVTLRDVSLGYDGRPVLERVSFAIGRGEFAALLGPNGAGKTTLFRGLLGLIPVLAGEIAWSADRRTRPFGYVPQKEALDPIFPLTAFEVVLMGTYGGLGPLRPLGRARRARAADALAQVGLADLAEQPFWALSGGQKQRVLVARALAMDSDVLFLDEPTAGIDSRAEAAIMDLIARLHRERGHTVVLVSHHLRLVERLVESVIWVEDRAVTKGPAAALCASAFGRGLA
ncbi:MAG TPA: metal ABC transporter ATP-binding protein [Candidatus Binatia bacterium]|nr:metal ABC transporter ATP-binding protein [Candidatus Binatia bacterium]